MLSSIGRAAIRRVGGSTNRAGSVLHSAWASTKSIHNTTVNVQFALPARRLYATAVKATPKSAAAVKKTTKSKPATKKAAPKKKLAKKPVKKAKKKVAAKKKPVKRPAKKIKKKTPEQLEKALIKELRATALLSGPPRKPDTAWLIVTTEHFAAKKGSAGNGVTSGAKEASAKYKSLTPAELEQLNHTANENKKANEIAIKAWVESHTPDQIRLANNARLLLKKKGVLKSKNAIHDDRIPTRPRAAHVFFASERWASGDLKGIALADAAKLIISDFKALSGAERRIYEEKAAADKQRYEAEFKTVFHRDTPTQQHEAKAKTTV